MFKFILLWALSLASLDAAWIDRKAEGWAWYEDPNKEDEKTSIPKEKPESIEQVRKELEDRLSKALLNPTDENIREYMKEQQKWVNKSEQFAIAWAKILLQHPELDETLKNPTSQYGIQLKEHIRQQKRRVKIEELARNNGLFFYYEGNAKTSQAFSEVVTNFAEKYGWTVLAISIDDVLLPDFPSSKLDNGISKMMQVKVFPSLYIVDPKQKLVTPIAYGLATLSDIENNIDTQFPTED